MDGLAPRLEVFKALGDNTRYAIYLELARSPRPLATAEIAAQLNLHVNTVRPHLEKMRDAGLLEVAVDARGGVGRPQHRYGLVADAPSLGLEPPVFPLATRMLLRMAADAGLGHDEAVDAGRESGATDGRAAADRAVPCVDALVQRLADLGFDPAVVSGDDATTIAFTHCPFLDLAESNPDLVCGLHRGLVEGFLDGFAAGHAGQFAAAGDSPADPPSGSRFRTLVDRNPCQVDLVGVSPAAGMR